MKHVVHTLPNGEPIHNMFIEQPFFANIFGKPTSHPQPLLWGPDLKHNKLE